MEQACSIGWGKQEEILMRAVCRMARKMGVG